MTWPGCDDDAVTGFAPAPGLWAADASCIGLLDAFTPARKPSLDDLDVARRVCRHCPVAPECRRYADEWAVYGLWAGRWYDTTHQAPSDALSLAVTTPSDR